MRIQLLTHSFGPEISPPQRRWTTFIEKFLERGADVDVVAPNRLTEPNWSPFDSEKLDDSLGEFVLRSFKYRFHGRRWFSKVLAQFFMLGFMLPSALKAPRPDLLIVTVPALPTLLAGYIVSKVRRVPLIVEMRDAWPELISESGVIRWKPIEKIAIRVIHHMQLSASMVVAVTPGHSLVLANNGCKNVKSVSNGYRFKTLKGKKRGSRDSFSRLKVLYLGNLGESQGLHKVLDIAAVSKDWMELRIVGKGSALTSLELRADELGLIDVFNPPVKGENVLAWYDWADTCIVSLREDWKSFDYTIPSKLFELAGYGCHITGLVSGEAKNLIDTYELGKTYEGDVLSISNSWFRDSSTVRNWKSNPKKLDTFREKFDLEIIGDQYFDILESHNELFKGRKN